MTSSIEVAEHPRVAAFVERFRCIDVGMRDLPIYNDKVAIEAVGFRLFGDAALLGVMLTPWFMNMIELTIEPMPMDIAEIGRTVMVDLPAGERAFVVGGDEVIGRYKAHSLHSPMLAFTFPGQARAEALRMLAALMTPPAAPAEPAPTRAAIPAAVNRRALLFVRRNA